MGSSIFCGVAQIAVHRSHKPAGGGASPPATSIVVITGVRPGLISPGELPDQRRRLGSTPRTTTNLCPWPEGFRGPCYERGSQWLDSTHGCQIHTHADGASAPALRRQVASVRLTPWVPLCR